MTAHPNTTPYRARPALHSGLDDDAEQLHHALIQLKRAYRHNDRDRICCHDISVTQCWALRELDRLGRATLNQLAAALQLDKSTVSRVVDALERKGYVSRAPHPADGRAVLIEATAAGDDLRARIEADLLDQERRMLSEFEPEVRRGVVRMLRRLAGAAARQLGSGDPEPCEVDCTLTMKRGIDHDDR
jgi:DNA-binding MarR family transcriptional regulator